MYFAKTPGSFPSGFTTRQEEKDLLCHARSFVGKEISQQNDAKKIVELLRGRKLLFCIGHEKADSVFEIAVLCQALAKHKMSVKIWINKPLEKAHPIHKENFPKLLKEKGLSEFVVGFPLENIPPTIDKDVLVIPHGWHDEKTKKILARWSQNGADCCREGDELLSYTW